MKKNGFVLIETIVVVSVLTLLLMMLYSSYSYLLTKSRNKNNYDNTEYIYKMYNTFKYFCRNYMNKNCILSLKNSIGFCKKLNIYEAEDKDSYVCDFTSFYNPFTKIYGITNIYFINNKNGEFEDKNNLLLLDATAIDYVKNKITREDDIIIFRFVKKRYDFVSGEFYNEVCYSTFNNNAIEHINDENVGDPGSDYNYDEDDDTWDD